VSARDAVIPTISAFTAPSATNGSAESLASRSERAAPRARMAPPDFGSSVPAERLGEGGGRFLARAGGDLFE
jgi:hypothetical protein